MPAAATRSMIAQMVDSLAPTARRHEIALAGTEQLPSCFAVTSLAAASIATACHAIAELVSDAGTTPGITVDHRLASLWFGFSIRPSGWALPSAWDEIAGDYPARDGWIKLHTNAPHHKAAAIGVLACRATRDAVAAAVRNWGADALEQAIVDAGGCAARLRTREEWLAHCQGRAVQHIPLVVREPAGQAQAAWRPTPGRPLAGVRVLDLTRVLAGPVATRFLAGFGAEVLRIDPPGWEEPGVVPEVTLGKRCARLDLHQNEGRARFAELLAQADVLVHGYREGALARLGFGPDARASIRPGLIDVSLNAYGARGPWCGRRGFDSLVQFSTGIAAAGMAWRNSGAPLSLPVQALDHATGYLMAAAAVRGLIARLHGEPAERYRLALASTAELLFRHCAPPTTSLAPAAETEFGAMRELTAWGPAHRLRPAAEIAGAPMVWPSPAVALGSAAPSWSD